MTIIHHYMTKPGITIALPMHTLIQHQLSANQWLTLWLLYSKDWDSLVEYAKAHGGCCTPEEMQRLLDRGYLLNWSREKDAAITADNLHVTEKFTDLLYGFTDGAITDNASPMVDDDVAFEELFQAYPPWIMVQGERKSGRGGDYEELCNLYGKITQGKRSKHAEIVGLLQWGLANGLVNMGLERFLKSRQWLGLQQAREAGGGEASFNNDI